MQSEYLKDEVNLYDSVEAVIKQCVFCLFYEAKRHVTVAEGIKSDLFAFRSG